MAKHCTRQSSSDPDPWSWHLVDRPGTCLKYPAVPYAMQTIQVRDRNRAFVAGFNQTKHQGTPIDQHLLSERGRVH